LNLKGRGGERRNKGEQDATIWKAKKKSNMERYRESVKLNEPKGRSKGSRKKIIQLLREEPLHSVTKARRKKAAGKEKDHINL